MNNVIQMSEHTAKRDDDWMPTECAQWAGFVVMGQCICPYCAVRGMELQQTDPKDRADLLNELNEGGFFRPEAHRVLADIVDLLGDRLAEPQAPQVEKALVKMAQGLQDALTCDLTEDDLLQVLNDTLNAVKASAPNENQLSLL